MRTIPNQQTRTDSSQAKNGVGEDQGVKVEKSVQIDRPVELYQFWRRLENLPRIMRHVESVWVSADGNSHWKVRALADKTVEWEAQIINEKENELIVWQSIAGSQVDNAGSVRFSPAPEGGTQIKVALKYDPPGGKLGIAVAKIFRADAAAEIEEDLAKFKQFMEAGEVASTEGQPSARKESKSKGAKS